MSSEEWTKRLDEMWDRHDLSWRSFPSGVALYYLITEGGLNWYTEEDALNEFCELALEILDDELAEALQHSERDYDSRALAELLDISELDEIARMLMGEYDEDEEEIDDIQTVRPVMAMEAGA